MIEVPMVSIAPTNRLSDLRVRALTTTKRLPSLRGTRFVTTLSLTVSADVARVGGCSSQGACLYRGRVISLVSSEPEAPSGMSDEGRSYYEEPRSSLPPDPLFLRKRGGLEGKGPPAGRMLASPIKGREESKWEYSLVNRYAEQRVTLH
jgi:hypothetical protein